MLLSHSDPSTHACAYLGAKVNDPLAFQRNQKDSGPAEIIYRYCRPGAFELPEACLLLSLIDFAQVLTRENRSARFANTQLGFKLRRVNAMWNFLSYNLFTSAVAIMVLWLIFTSLVAYVAWSVVCLQMNARIARELAVPAIRIPFDVNNKLWVIFQPLVWRVLARLPVSWAAYPDFVRFSHRNWHFLEKSSPIARFGPVWALVSPGGVHLHVSDPESIQNIFMRFRDFYRPIHKYRESLLDALPAPDDLWKIIKLNQPLMTNIEMLSIFGQNVFTVGISDWLRHRKAVAKPLHEITMDFIWHESLRQTQYVQIDHTDSLR